MDEVRNIVQALQPRCIFCATPLTRNPEIIDVAIEESLDQALIQQVNTMSAIECAWCGVMHRVFLGTTVARSLCVTEPFELRSDISAEEQFQYERSISIDDVLEIVHMLEHTSKMERFMKRESALMKKKLQKKPPRKPPRKAVKHPPPASS